MLEHKFNGLKMDVFYNEAIRTFTFWDWYFGKNLS